MGPQAPLLQSGVSDANIGSRKFAAGASQDRVRTATPIHTTVTYRTYYDLNGNVYTGELTKAGTVIGGSSYRETIAGVSSVNYTSKLQLRVNKAAVDSLHAAVTF